MNLSDAIYEGLCHLCNLFVKPTRDITADVVTAWEKTLLPFKPSIADLDAAFERAGRKCKRFPVAAEVLECLEIEQQSSGAGGHYQHYRCPVCDYAVAMRSETPVFEPVQPCPFIHSSGQPCGKVMVTEKEYHRRQVCAAPSDPDIKARFAKLFNRLSDKDPFSVDVPGWAKLEEVAR